MPRVTQLLRSGAQTESALRLQSSYTKRWQWDLFAKVNVFVTKGVSQGLSWMLIQQHRHYCCCCPAAKSCLTLWSPRAVGVACQAPLSMGFPRQEYWGGCHFLLQGIFPTQGSNPCLLHCRWILHCWATREDLTHSLLVSLKHKNRNQG